MEVASGAVMLAIAGWCAGRLVAPERGVPRHGRALGAWHLVMAVAMAAMLLTSVPGPPAVGAGVFAVGAGWALARAALVRPRGSHLRLAAASAAMAAMLTPDPAGATAAVTGMHTGPGTHAMATLPVPALAVLLVALTAVLATCVLRLARAGTAGTVRVDAACEALMAVAMAAMLLSVL